MKIAGYENCSSFEKVFAGRTRQLISSGIGAIAIWNEEKDMWEGATWHRKGRPNDTVFNMDSAFAEALNQAKKSGNRTKTGLRIETKQKRENK